MEKSSMNKFSNLIVLGPLIYVIHHFEEHIIFNFREWRIRYFLDNNSLATEEVLLRLLAVLLIWIFLHLVKRNRASAHVILFFLMTTQVVNAFFHVFFSFYFLDFSPGAITAVLLYLPVNYFIFKAALNEEYLGSKKEIVYTFILGASTFALFEMIGPKVMQITMLLAVAYYFVFNKYDNKNQLSKNVQR
tara:strand:- start:312 stop:881 length:570 start_codon:yes stop_codon:yes gene_type:complete